MPKKHHKMDKVWLEEQLNLVRTQMRQGLCDKYDMAWSEAERLNKASLFPEDFGRSSANQRFRQYVSKYQAASNGFVSPLPTI